MFRSHSEIQAYWYNISVGDSDDSITKLLGISYSYFEKLMLSLNLFYYYGKVNKQVRIRSDNIIRWGENKGLLLELDFYKPFGSNKNYYIRLGQFHDNDKFDCKY